MAPSFANRSNVAVDVEAIWHHLSATGLGVKLGAKICGAELGVVNVATAKKK